MVYVVATGCYSFYFITLYYLNQFGLTTVANLLSQYGSYVLLTVLIIMTYNCTIAGRKSDLKKAQKNKEKKN